MKDLDHIASRIFGTARQLRLCLGLSEGPFLLVASYCLPGMRSGERDEGFHAANCELMQALSGIPHKAMRM